MSARAALSSRSSPSLLVASLPSLLSFPAFAQLSNKRLSLSHQKVNRGFGIANDRGTAPVEQYYGEPLNTANGPLHGSVVFPWEDSVLRGWDPVIDPKVLLVRPSPFPSALIQRGDSWPALPRVELIQKVSNNTKNQSSQRQS